MEGKKTHKEVTTYFIIPSSCKNEHEVSDTMKMAFQEVEEAGLTPQWVGEENCDLEHSAKNTVFVLQEFKGELFSKLRSTKSVRVCGPMCIRSCIAEGLPIPENKSPVYTTAMRGVVVTASQISTAVKINIKEKVGFMGGVYMNNLIHSVTHLVTNAVRSAKYEVACEKGIPVMTVDWVDAAWERSQKRNVKATDPELVARYKCPVFLNMFITCSNLSKKEKQEMKDLISQNGGTFTTQLRQTETTLLVISEPRGEKYKHARSWDLPCVLPSYIRESVKCGYAVPSKSHLISTGVSCSTPTKGEDAPNFTFNSETSVSMINMDCSKTHVDDTQLTNCSLASASSQQRKPPKPPGSNHSAVINELSVSEAKKAGSFVDGCKIFLSGFTAAEREKLRRVLCLGGATLFSELSDNVSHVIVGDFVVSDMKTLMSLAQKPHTVTVEWVPASIALKAPAEEESYYCLETRRVAPEPPSPLSQKGLQLLQPPQDVSERSMMPPPAEPAVSRKLFSEFLKENTRSPAKQAAETSVVDSMSSSSISTLPEIFADLTFVIIGFLEEVTADIEKAVREGGGTVVAANFTGVADYALVPLLMEGVNITAVEVATNYWLEDCLESGMKLPLHYYHQPLSLDVDKKPLADACVSLSSFSGKEKSFLMELVQLLGATYQDVFARVGKAQQDILPCTHLVCPKPEGQKFAASVKWGIPAVTKDWLLACARQGTRVSETQYLVADSADKTLPLEVDSKRKISDTPMAATPSVAKTSAPVTTPSLGLPVSEANTNTPVSAIAHRAVSSLKRKSSAITPDDLSPFHVATPDTPYGQVFETPTADKKKKWKRFINDFPCKPNSPPPPSKTTRRDSTPLSELKRRIWKVALGEEEGRNCSSQNQSMSTPDYAEKQDAKEIVGSATPSSIRGSENKQPRKMSVGRSTPSAKDFKSASGTPASQPRVSKILDEAPEKVKKSPANEMVCAMLGQLYQRLSTPGSGSEEPRRPPQRELVSHNTPPPSLQPVTTNQPESQPVLLDWEDPVESAQRAKAMGSGVPSPASITEEQRPRKFVLSNVHEKSKCEEMLMNLGESVITTAEYDEETTHLIVDEPLRSEKLLCSLAAGNWVLHTSFIHHMVKCGRYVPDEELYEWGNSKSEGRLPPIMSTGIVSLLACAAVRWRRKLQDTTGTGAFTGMRAILITVPAKQESYKRLIAAGGGEIIPLTSFKEATHCFVEEKKIPTMPIPLARFASLNIPCLFPVFLGDMLIKNPPPSVQDACIPEYRRLLLH